MPLNSDQVCDLHGEGNLQGIPTAPAHLVAFVTRPSSYLARVPSFSKEKVRIAVGEPPEVD